jgi:hypothetical protein
MNMRLCLPLGLLLGLSTFAALGADEPAAPPAGGEHDVHINMHVSDSIDSDGGSISMAGKDVLVKVKGIADARVTADGSLSIGKKPVTVSADGRKALLIYHDQGRSVVDQGKAMGKEGVYFAFNTMGNVFASMLTGSDDEASHRVEKDAKKFQKRAEALCNTLGELRDAQDAVASAVPEFAPYAGVVTAKSVTDCNKDATDTGQHQVN